MPRLTRRSFLGQIAALSLAPGLVRAQSKAPRLPIAFSTLGCPKWDWKTVLDHAAEWGFTGIELRGVKGQLDLPKVPEFSSERIAGSKTDLAALGLKITDLGASANMHEADESKRRKQLEEGRRFIDLAHQLGAPYVRVFGNKFVPGESRETTMTRVSEGLRLLGEHAQGSGVTVIIESHGDFVESPVLKKILDDANHPNVALLWDAHHTCVVGKEPPEKTYAQLSKYIRHTHLKDSKPGGKDAEYVLTGEGTVPVRETVQVLKKGGYTGFYCFEWEKLWHPEIQEPEVAFPHYAKKIREYLV